MSSDPTLFGAAEAPELTAPTVQAAAARHPTPVGDCWCDDDAHPGEGWFAALRRPQKDDR